MNSKWMYFRDAAAVLFALGMTVTANSARAADYTITSGTVEATDANVTGATRVIVDNTANADATLHIANGVTFNASKDILLNNDGTLINEGTISRTGSGYDGVFGDVGPAHLINQAGGSISVGDIGMWLKGGGSLLNTGATTSITGRIGADIWGTSTITNELGATIHASGAGLYFTNSADATITNQSGATITSDTAEGIIVFGTGNVTNTGEDSAISGFTDGITITGADAVIKNLDGARISGGDHGLKLVLGGTVTNGADASISAGVGIYAGDILTVENAGTIEGTDDDGVNAQTEGSSLTNKDGGVISGVAYGVDIGGDVTNTGAGSKISGGVLGVQTQYGATLRNEEGAAIESDYLAVEMYDGGDVYNTGGSTITSTNTDGVDIWVYGSLTNSGVGSAITAGGYAGAYFDALGDDSVVFTLTNSDHATIKADSYGVTFFGHADITNEGGASITSISGSGVDMESGGTVTNQSGGVLTGLVTGLFLHADPSESFTVTNTGAGSVISGTSVDTDLGGDGIYASAPASVTNSDGASITGTRFGVWLGEGGDFTNEGEDTLVSGGFTGVFASQSATIINQDKASIEGVNSGVLLEGGGTVTNSSGATIHGTQDGVKFTVSSTLTNESGATITGDTDNGVNSLDGGSFTNKGSGSSIYGLIAGVYVDGSAGTVTNEDGATISAGYGAIGMFKGGSVTNGAGSTLDGGTYGIYIEGGAATVSNAGSIIGSVDFEGGYANHVTLFTGSSIDGDLFINNSTHSTLTFDGTGTERLSDAVTGTFAFGGTLTKQGTGTWIIDKNLLANETDVTAGSLIVGYEGIGKLFSDVTVSPGALLGGSGTIYGDVTVNGTVAPGNSPGTLTIVGDYVQGAGSTYQAQIDPGSGVYDKIVVTGTATIDPTSTLNITKLGSAPYIVGTQYVFVTATTGVTGSYILTGDTEISPFLSLSDHYDASKGYLEVVQTQSFVDVATTSNQSSLGASLQSNPTSSIFTLLANLPSVTSATSAFNLLSGEVYASAQTAAIEDSHYVRDAAFSRLGDALCGDTTLAAGGSVRTDCTDQHKDGYAIWGQSFGSWNHSEGDANVGTLTHDASGLFAGIDVPLADWRVGVLGGFGRGEFDLQSRLSDGTSADYHVGAYGGRQWGALGLRLMASESWHDLTVARQVAFPGFSDSLDGGTTSNVSQAAGEVSYRMASEAAVFEPFLNLAHVNQRLDRFTEAGGAAALVGEGDDTNTSLSTVGLRASNRMDWQDVSLVVHGSLGWRHAFGDIQPDATLHMPGNTPYEIAGVPVALNAGLIEGGFNLRLSEATTIDVSYRGQFGQAAVSNAVTGALNVAF